MTSLPKMMIACRVSAFGPPSAIAFEQIPVPTPGEGEVLVRVHAAGVGPWDGWIRSGKSALPQPLPLTLGSDLAGIVELVGPGVHSFKAGDLVFGVTNPRFTGAYAEYAIASAAMIARKPADLDFVDAASVPVVAVTAWQALFDEAKLAKGQSVLIHGGAGNVGAYAIQLAHEAGLKVVATVGPDDVTVAKALGADQVVDHRATAFETVVEPVDAVLDLVGGETQLAPSRSSSGAVH
jgi:NADPH:quinone reductase-like Zn-dependent oxidoreductase